MTEPHSLLGSVCHLALSLAIFPILIRNTISFKSLMNFERVSLWYVSTLRFLHHGFSLSAPWHFKAHISGFILSNCLTICSNNSLYDQFISIFHGLHLFAHICTIITHDPAFKPCHTTSLWYGPGGPIGTHGHLQVLQFLKELHACLGGYMHLFLRGLPHLSLKINIIHHYANTARGT